MFAGLLLWYTELLQLNRLKNVIIKKSDTFKRLLHTADNLQSLLVTQPEKMLKMVWLAAWDALIVKFRAHISAMYSSI